MRKITLDSGKTFEVDFAYAPTFDGACHIRLSDNRRLPEVAKDFDRVQKIDFRDDETGDEHFNGYTRLQSIFAEGGKISIKLQKE